MSDFDRPVSRQRPNLRAGVGPAREQELAKRIAAKDLSAANELAEGNIAWADAVAERYCRLFPALADDIRQAARLGLVKASRKFKAGRARFTTYSRYWIDLNVQQWISTSVHFIYMPETLRRRVVTATRSAHGESDPLDLCKPQTWQAARDQADNEPISLDAIEDPERVGPHTGIEDGEAKALDHVDHREKHDAVNVFLSALTPKEKQVLTLRFGLDGDDGRTLSDVGNDMNLSRERIRQIQDEALIKLKAAAHRALTAHAG